MKKSFLFALCSLTASALMPAFAQKTTLKPLWETDTTIRTPESVLYNPAQKILYVACINGGPSLANKKPVTLMYKDSV